LLFYPTDVVYDTSRFHIRAIHLTSQRSEVRHLVFMVLVRQGRRLAIPETAWAFS
jgi:hypothetical protein